MPGGFPLQIVSLLALCALLFSLRSAFGSRRYGFAHRKFIAACAVVILLAVFGISGCGGGGGGSVANPQSIPTPQPAVTPTPQGTFTILLTPMARTASGTLLAPMSPIQLTLIVQ